MEHKITVTVIGGANADICGASFHTPVAADSNPGRVYISSGGVGRNIAHNLCLLGANVNFFSAFGGGELSKGLIRECRSLGMNLEGSVIDEALPCSSYLCVNDEKGELVIAVNDMEVLNSLDADALKGRLDSINSSDAVVMDTNLSTEAVEYICSNCEAPVFCDAVSTIKAVKVLPWLSRIYALKANLAEAILLSGETDALNAAGALCRMGVKHSFVSCGSRGMAYCSAGGEAKLAEAAPCKVINSSGAGDATTAALVYALTNKLCSDDAARFAMKAGALACESKATVNPDMGILTGFID